MLRDQHYVIEEGKIILVDELTGRLADQRTLSLGMQQILEASQSLEISPPTVVSARMSFQRFFQRAGRLGGMTGTAEEARSEFLGVYRLTTLKIPTHQPVQRQVWPVFYCKNEQEKFEQIAQSALAQLALGRAVLIGMRSVRSSTALYAHIHALRPELEIGLLHAVQHQQESALVARAGQPGALTIATNMAGRGTDIALHDSVKSNGGLHVVIGEANDFSRIDRQLLGRGARQGNPGSVQYFIAEDEELLRRFLPDSLRRLGFRLYALLPRTYILQGLLKLAQYRAERQAWQQRKNILKMDTELERSGF
jgi:preprotein translocase subunit SecA